MAVFQLAGNLSVGAGQITDSGGSTSEVMAVRPKVRLAFRGVFERRLHTSQSFVSAEPLQ